MTTKTTHTLCICGCGERTKSAAAQYLPGHAPQTVKIEDAAGLWVELVKISEEPPAYARITTTKDLGLFIQFTVAEHPTCGHFTWEYPRGTVLRVRPERRRK